MDALPEAVRRERGLALRRFHDRRCDVRAGLSRFWTYGVEVCPLARAYMDTVRELPIVQRWAEEAQEEDDVTDLYEVGT